MKMNVISHFDLIPRTASIRLLMTKSSIIFLRFTNLVIIIFLIGSMIDQICDSKGVVGPSQY